MFYFTGACKLSLPVTNWVLCWDHVFRYFQVYISHMHLFILSLSTSNPVWFGSRMMPCDSLAISLPEP